MTQLIAIDQTSIERVLDKLDALERRLNDLDIKPLPEWVPVAEYARMKGVSARTVKRRIERGEIEARGTGKGREVKAR